MANEIIKEKQKRNIAAAARKTFALKGSRATMGEIAQVAEISQGLIYRYFSSKDELLLFIMNDLADRPASPQDSTNEISGSPLEKIGEMVSCVISNRKNEPYLYKFIYQALIDEKTPEEIRQKIASRGLRARETIYNLIVAGQKRGEIAQDDPNILVLSLFDCIEGAWRRMAYQNTLEIGDTFPPVEIILRMLKDR